MNQILNICVNMEHSYSGDLDITIISPNGQEAQLFEQAGFGTYFGGANDSGTGPGVGETYCFSMNASVLLENAPTVIAGTPANDSWQPGTYLPFQSFNNLVGSPLNGTWTIEIVDNIGIDDGYIFEWYIEFDPNLQPPEYSFTPVITGESWDADTSIISENGASIVVQPSSDGTFCYTYRVTDDFGCEYFEEICVEVYPEILVNAPDNLYTCETGATSYAFDLLSNDAVILAGNSSPGDYVITYYGSQTDADSETNALVGDLTAYMGVDDEIIYVRVEYLNTDCFETFSFTLNTIAQPVINAVDDIILCDDQGNDGVELFNLDSQTSDILDTQDPADFIVTYYLSQADADAASGELTSPYSSGNASIYVRIDDVGGAGCFIVSSAPVFDLVLLPADDSSFTLTAECNGVTAGITGALGGTFSFATAPTDGAVIDPNTGLVSNGSYATTYDVSYTTIGICPTTTTQSITTLDADDSSFVLTPNCNGATASITGLAGGTFSFAVQPIDSAVLDAATGEISNAPYGATYSVMYLSNGPCPTMTTVDVTVFDEEFATFTMTPSCDGGTATITGDTGGVFTFTTAPTDGAVIDAVTGTITLGSYSTTYDVTYTTAGPCPVNTTESVTVLDEEFSDFTMTPTCDGGTATITGDAGGVFAFVTAPTDGAVIDTTTGEVTGATPSATYDVIYATSGPCPDETIFSLTVLDEEFATFTMSPTCDGGLATITGNTGGIFTFATLPADGAVIDATTGIVSGGSYGATYSVTYTTAGPCPDETTVDVTVFDEEFATFTMTPSCDGGTATITGDTGGVFTFTTAPTDGAVIDAVTGTITLGSYSTTYDVTYTTAGPCPVNTTESVTVLDEEFSDFTMTPTCDGGTATITGDAGGVFAFVTAPTDGAVIDTTTGEVTGATPSATYDVIYATSGPCPDETIFSLTVLDEEFATFTMSPTCDGGLATITGNTGGIFTFATLPADGAVIDATTGIVSGGSYGATYSVTYTTAGPCPDETTVDVTVFDEEFATFTMTPSCDGGTATITGDTGGVFTFTTAPTDGAVIDAVTGTITLGSYSTTYDVTYTTAGPCPVNTTESVTVLDEEFSDFTMTPTCDGGTATITGDAGGVFAFVTAPTDGAVIDTTTGEVTGGVGGSTYQISYITSGPCTSVTEQSLTSILIDDASFTITPGCDGGVPVISGLAGGVFSFLVTPTDGAIIDPVTGIVSNAPFGASYTIRYDTNGPCVNFSEVTFTVYEQPLIFMPAPLDVCDDNVPDYITEFDLSVKNNEITGANPDYLVTYHFDQADADAGVGALPNPYLGQNGQVVFVRVVDATTGCYSLTTLDLVVNQAPAAFTPTSLIYCDADNDGFGTFTLSDATDQITSGDTTLVVTYHETLSNAENSANALLSPYDNIVQDLQTVYARVESSLITTGCATIVSFDLIVNPTPQLTDPTPLTQCDTDTDGFEPFNLNDKSTEILNGLDPLQYVLSFYLTQLDADSATNAISAPGFFTNTIANNQTIWVRVEDTSNGCYKLTSLELIVYALPVLVQPDPLELCDDAIADGLTVFDLTQSNNQITGGNGALEVLYYETESDAISGTNAIDPETSYTNTSISGAAANPQTVFVGVTDPVTGCVSYTTLTLRVLPNPTPGLTPEDIELCDENNPGDGIEVFDLTENEIYILNGESGVALTYYESEFDAQESQNAIVDPTQYSNTISPQTIYVRDTNIVTGCYSIVSFDLLVDPLPESTTITDYIVCELNTDQLYGFDLISKDVEILNGQDPSVFTVSYYATQGDAAAATNALLSPYNNTSNPQAIYVVITNTQTMCTVGGMSFAIEVQESAQANPDLQPLTYVICDQTDANDGFAAFDLSTMNAQVLDGQNTANYVVSYYGSQSDADAGINALDNIYQNISNPQTIYARVSNVSTTTSVCYATAPLELEVNLLPIFDLEDSYLLCENTNGTEVVGPPMMDTGLSSADYSFEWQFNSGVIAGATASSYTATQAGTYSVTVTNLTTLCDNTVQTTVISSEPPILTAEVTSMVFADNATVEATVVGNGNYELSIDNGPWTTDTIFTGLSDGIHQIWARDITGCGEVMVEVLVIGYPLFFTPNGDGYNDTWNIFSLSDQLETKIYIFDRYGKLLKEIRPQGRGWDGTYNGALMPSSDYWFTVHYLDLSTNKIKQHKAHFTLKR